MLDIIFELEEEEKIWWKKRIKQVRSATIHKPDYYVQHSIEQNSITKEQILADPESIIHSLRESAWSRYLQDECVFHKNVISDLVISRNLPRSILATLLCNDASDLSKENALDTLAPIIGDFTGRIMPYIYEVSLSTTQSRRNRAGKTYRLTDNQLVLNSGYNNDLLKFELTELSSIYLGFDIEITGFETAEIDLRIDGAIAEDDPADALPEIDETAAPITKLGDVWQLGKHRLVCGDSTNAETYTALVGDEKAQAIFTDPPYNVKINSHVCGNGKIKHREFAMASGEMSKVQFTEFLAKFIKLSIEFSANGPYIIYALIGGTLLSY